MNTVISLDDIRCSKPELVNGVGETSGVFCGKLSDTYLNDCDCSIQPYEGTAMDALVQSLFNSVEEQDDAFNLKLSDGRVVKAIENNLVLAVKNDKGMQFFSIVPN